MSSTEIVRIGQANEFDIQVKFPRAVEDLAGYFAGSNMLDGSRFRNFEPAARALVSSLDSMAGLSRTGDVEARLIPLNPAKSEHEPGSAEFLSAMEDQHAFKLRATDEQLESQALIDMTYLLTEATDDPLYDTRHDGIGYVVMHGTHNDSHVYFVENYLRDAEGDYMLWSAASGVPAAVYNAEQGRRIEVERDIFRKEVEAGLQDIPVIELDQAA